jgi:quercetin dioxygenase-like cupin family protein
MADQSFHLPNEAAPAFQFREHTFRLLATSSDTGGSYSTMHIVSPHGTGPGAHTHDDAEESFYLLAGEVDFEVQGATFRVRPGDFVHVPRGVVHRFVVLSPTAHMLATYAPAGEEQAFQEASTPLE